MGFQEFASEPEQSANISLQKTSSLPSLPKSSISTNFNGLDLFSETFAPQNVTSTHTPVSNTQLPESSTSLSQPVNLFQQYPVASVAAFNEQQSSQSQWQQSVVSSHVRTSDVVMPENGGWATFDIPLNFVPMGTENSIPVPAAVPSSSGNSFNPFSLDQSSSNQNSAYHEPSASTHTLWHEGLQNVEAATNNTKVSSIHLCWRITFM